MKVYYNLTRILNGWVLKYYPYKDDAVVYGESEDKYFKTLPEAYEFISTHAGEIKKKDSMGLRHLFKEEE